VSKFDWSRARSRAASPGGTENTIRAGMRADRQNWLRAKREAPKNNIAEPYTARPAYRARKHTGDHDIWIVVGADCPWNATPGTRQAYHFRNRTEAREAGFAV
jgi:hypothetical protein